MADYRLSVAQGVLATRKLSDKLGAPYEDSITVSELNAFADVFLRMAGKARDRGVITEESLTELRDEIRVRLRPAKPVKYDRRELKVLQVLGASPHALTSAEVAQATGLPRRAVNSALYALRGKKAVQGNFGHNYGAGHYLLTEKAAEFRSAPMSAATANGAVAGEPQERN